MSRKISFRKEIVFGTIYGCSIAVFSFFTYFFGLVTAFNLGAVWFVASLFIPPVAFIVGLIEIIKFIINLFI